MGPSGCLCSTTDQNFQLYYSSVSCALLPRLLKKQELGVSMESRSSLYCGPLDRKDLLPLLPTSVSLSESVLTAHLGPSCLKWIVSGL